MLLKSGGTSTLRLKQALELVEVRLLDHIVVSADGTASLAMRGWL